MRDKTPADHRTSRPDGPIFLIGFMGTGKTSTSGELKDLLGFDEIDLDEAIASRYGMSIAEMFERDGEDAFRERESAMLKEIAGGEPVIVSCGGGCVLREENVSLMKGCGTVVLLTAEPETVLARVKHRTTRPLLNGHMNVEYIADLMEQRRPAYEKACDLTICTDQKTPRQVAEEVSAALGR
ncbi:MAG: shikimate kinase [Lachnospiraceae bacterium]|nr:shikimate kinase [Lachnospiraceae bacterium]